MKTVFLFVGKPVFFGDFLNTGYIKYLSDKFNVVIFIPKNEGGWAQGLDYFHSPSITYVNWKIENTKLLDLMKYVRFSCIREFDHLHTIHYHRNQRDPNQDTNNTLLRIVSKPFSGWLSNNFFYKLELLLLKRSPIFCSYLKKYKPALVLVATPGFNHLEAEGLLLAKKYGVKSVSVDCNWDGLTSRVTRLRPTDYFIAWHEPMKKEAVEIHHFDPAKVFVSGSIRFDHHFNNSILIQSKEEFLRSKGLDPKNKTIFYSAQQGHLFEAIFLKKLIDLRDSGDIPYVNVFVRDHPLAVSKPGRFSKFLGLSNVHVEKPAEVMTSSDLTDLIQALRCCDININCSSSVSLEAILADKPVINYIERSKPIFDYDHYRPLVKMGAVKLIESDPVDLARAVNAYLADPGLDRPSRTRAAEIYFPFRDGLAYKRSVDFLETIIEAN